LARCRRAVLVQSAPGGRDLTRGAALTGARRRTRSAQNRTRRPAHRR